MGRRHLFREAVTPGARQSSTRELEEIQTVAQLLKTMLSFRLVVLFSDKSWRGFLKLTSIYIFSYCHRLASIAREGLAPLAGR
jgi:hypothetical protein